MRKRNGYNPKYYDREKWPKGEWDNEPDELEWEHKGLKCAIFRNSFGGLCGYVGVDRTHPYWEKEYSDLQDISVHGGLTFSSWIDEKKELYYLGFDCCHFGDVSPYDKVMDPSLVSSNDPGRSYKNMEYVKNEVEGLAEQVLQASKETTIDKTTLFN